MAADDTRLRELISGSLDGTLDADEAALLDRIILQDPAARWYYLEYIHVDIGLVRLFSGQVQDVGEPADVLDVQLWHQLSRQEKTAESIQTAHRPIRPAVTPENLQAAQSPRRISRVSLYTALVSAAALFIMAVYVTYVPRRGCEAVASVVDTLGAAWDKSGPAVTAGNRLTNSGQMLQLQRGLVRIEFDFGAQAIVEGPASFSLRSAEQLYLVTGKACVYVPAGAAGFIVETPASRVVDLGTEFGVSVDDNGRSLIQMHQGKASLTVGRRGQTLSGATLVAGDAFRVDSQTGGMQQAEFEPDTFVRMFHSQHNQVWRGQDVSLADFIGSGDGFGSGLPDYEIDTVTGRLAGMTQAAGSRANGYVCVPESPYIDGIFIPDGGVGPVQVSSAGHVFEDCPDTLGTSWGNVCNGRWYEEGKAGFWRLEDADCGASTNPAICLHPNKGITFDLEAVRRMHPNLQIARFGAQCGISQTAVAALENAEPLPKASFFVLLDGQLRFRRDDVQIADGALLIDFVIDPDSRFLTLMTVNGSDNLTRWDWAVFVRPRLKLSR